MIVHFYLMKVRMTANSSVANSIRVRRADSTRRTLKPDLLFQRRAILIEYFPNFAGGDGNINSGNAEVRKCIYYGVCNGGWRADSCRFTHTLCSDGMMRRRCNGLAELPFGSF